MNSHTKPTYAALDVVAAALASTAEAHAVLERLRDLEIAHLYDDGHGVLQSAIARRLGRSPAWVCRRAALADDATFPGYLMRILAVEPGDTCPIPLAVDAVLDRLARNLRFPR